MPPQADNTAMRKLLSRALSGLLLVALTAWASPQQSHAEIRATIVAFVRAQTLALPGETAIKVGEIDRRVALPACPALEAFLPPGGQLLGNATVGVRCQGRNGWTLFVPVHVKVNASLLIASRPLQQGQALRAEDIARQSGELAQADILTDPAQAIGKVLKSGVGAGQVLRQAMLRAPYAVMQGQTVQLQVEGQGYQVHSEGQAMNNAAEGQSVRVKTSSGQVVSGVARPDGAVEIHPRQAGTGKQ